MIKQYLMSFIKFQMVVPPLADFVEDEIIINAVMNYQAIGNTD